MQEEILKYLKEKYSPEVVILHGSRASGKNRENSDWDIFVFTTKDIKGGPEEHNGNQLDVIVVRVPVEEDDFIDEYGYVINSSVLLLDSEEGLGKRLIEKSKELYSFGKKLTDEKLANRKNYMLRTLDRMSGSLDKPERFLLYLGYFYEKALQYWFDTKGKFSKPVYDAVPEIQESDPEYYALLRVLFSEDTNNSQKLEAANRIYKSLF